MGRYCWVPDCKSNRPGKKYVTSFRFPKDETLKKKWLRSIPMDFTPNKDVVCRKHFTEESIISVDKIVSKDGTMKEYKRKYPKLADDAYPTLFPDSASYLSKTISVRKVTIERKKKDGKT